jgi:hypothetical protein
MPGYSSPDFAPAFVVEIWTDDRELIAATEMTGVPAEANDWLVRVRRGFPLARLKWRPTEAHEWRECTDDDLTRAAFRLALAAADALTAKGMPFVNWSIYASGAEAHLDVVVVELDARRILAEYTAFFEAEAAIVPEAKHLSLAAVYQGVQVRMRCRAEAEQAVAA